MWTAYLFASVRFATRPHTGITRPHVTPITPHRLPLPFPSTVTFPSVPQVRHPHAAAVLPLRRHGEPVPDLRDPHPHRGRPEPRGRGCARDLPLLDGQPRHQRDVGELLAQRGLHHDGAWSGRISSAQS